MARKKIELPDLDSILKKDVDTNTKPTYIQYRTNDDKKQTLEKILEVAKYRNPQQSLNGLIDMAVDSFIADNKKALDMYDAIHSNKPTSSDDKIIESEIKTGTTASPTTSK